MSTQVYNVISNGYSIGLTRSLSEAETWKRKTSDTRAYIISTGVVERWEKPEQPKAQSANSSPMLCDSANLPPRPRATQKPPVGRHAKRGEPDRKAAKRLARRRNDYAKTMEGKAKFKCPGSLQRG